MLKKASLSLVTILAGVSLAHPAVAQSDDDKLGKVHFETSCNAETQKLFDRGMLYQHSFWYRASQKMFEDTLKADPACSIAYWGIALSLLWNPHSAPPAKNLADGAAAIEKARAVGFKTEREQAYVDALAVMYKDYDKVDHRTRVVAYAKAMEALAQRYKDDDEAQIHYALALNTSASPTDKTYASQLKGAAILEPIALRQPLHPGVAHYLIHLYDYPPIAQKGIEAAERYAGIAPSAPHAQHMPSHIFTRVGYWKESIASNAASIKAAAAEKENIEQLHARDYMVYAYLQLGRDREARAVVDEMLQAANNNTDVYGGSFALAASPARYAIERGDWKGAAALDVRPSKFPATVAIAHFARALGAARSGNAEAAKADIAKLAELRDKLREAKDAYWSNQVDIQYQIATAWLLNAQGKHDEALAAMKAAADAEDKTEKSPVTPGPLAPARELYGDMLLQRGMAKEALAAYQATMVKEPNRFNGFVGAARAAAALGDKATAKTDYEKLLALTADSNSDRPALAAARTYIASN